MDRPSAEVLSRMPLAEAVLLLWCGILSDERLEDQWSRLRGRCYKRVISFPLLVHLLADALLRHKGSGRRSFEKSIEEDELEASVQAAYRKLARLPIELSQGFLTENTAALRRAFPEWSEWQTPRSLRAFRIVVLDGKAIKRVAKRLLALRGASGGLLGGRALVAMEWATGMAIAMHAHADGDVNDVRFVADVLPVVREQLPGCHLFVKDSGFCDLTQTTLIVEGGDHFLVRYHPKVKFHPDSSRRPQTGINERGQKYVEDWGWLGSERDPRRRYVRRICLPRPGEKEVILITDLLDAAKYPAEDLLWLYLERWGIEQMFQKVTEVFGLHALIGGTPNACVFQFSFCLLLYNMLQVVRAYIAQAQDREPDEISSEKLFDDMQQHLIAWNIVVGPATTLNYFERAPQLNELQSRLGMLLRTCWSNTWIKAPKQKRNGPTLRKRTRSHGSVYRILEAARRRKRRKSRVPP